MEIQWKEELNKKNRVLYVLYLDEQELIRFTEEEDGCYIYASKLLNCEYNYLNEIEEVFSVDDAKKLCEEMIIEHCEDKIEYYEDIIMNINCEPVNKEFLNEYGKIYEYRKI